jgi:hypothetical protein
MHRREYFLVPISIISKFAAVYWFPRKRNMCHWRKTQPCGCWFVWIPLICCTQVLKPIGSILSDSLTADGHNEAEFGMSWCAGFGGAFYNSYFEVSTYHFSPHISGTITCSHADKECTCHHLKCWKINCLVTISILITSFAIGLYSFCPDKIKSLTLSCPHWVHSSERATQFLFPSSYLTIMCCTGWLLNLLFS